jgi:predicted DNA-binding transcriptional regulator YafY
VRADRLLSLVLLLQARGRQPAHALARELGVSVRTVYRDLEALSSAGVPVVADSGPNGGCRLLDGYRFPLRGLSASEAEALLLLGVPEAVAELGLADILATAHAKVSAAAPRPGGAPSAGAGLIHLDMPRWFRAREDVPHLPVLARALRERRHLEFGYRRGGASAGKDRPEKTRTAGPLGLVNKAGLWYLVASRDASGEPAVFRAGRITATRVLDTAFTPPAGFDLPAFWARWSAEFEASRPTVKVRLRVSPAALDAFGEIFGETASDAVATARPPDEDGFREITLTFEHEKAAAHRLAGFGGQVEVLSPESIRDEIVAAAREILDRYPRSPLSSVPGTPRSRRKLWCTARLASSIVIRPALTSSSAVRPRASMADSR